MSNISIELTYDEKFYYKHMTFKEPPHDVYYRHSHNSYEMLYLLSGNATYIVEDKKYKLQKGDLIIIRPSKYHLIQIDESEDYERQNILFDHKTLGVDVSALPEWLDVVHIEENSIVSGTLKKFDYYAQSLSKKDFCRVALLLTQEIIYNISFLEKPREAVFSAANPLLTQALNYIGENIFTLKDVAEIAKAVFVTESYLYRLFKRELLRSPRKYITEKRLLHAQTQLKKGRRPTDVAAMCGFDDYTTFYRNYSLVFGHSPSEEILQK